MQQAVIPVVERFLVEHDSMFNQGVTAEEVFRDYASNFDDPAAALNALTPEELQKFAQRIERRMNLDGKTTTF